MPIQTVSQAFTNEGAGGFTFRNRIINGDMTIDQRNAGASVTAVDATYTLDRWQTYSTPASKFSVQQNAGSVTPPVGFKNYLGVTSLSAYSVTSNDYFTIGQPIEGFNVADLEFGTANAKTITISFWVRSSLTGTFGAGVTNSAFNRSFPFSYTINSANTWEQKSVTIAGDTSGTWLTNNGRGLELDFGIGIGSTNSGTAGSWQSGWKPSVTGATSVVGTNGATFYITGVQLEVGSVATPFERRPYGAELQLCQRYFQKIDGMIGSAGTSTQVYVSLNYPIEMRANPTLSVSGAMEVSDIGAANYTQSSAHVAINGGTQLTTRGVIAFFNNFSGMTTYRPMLFLGHVNRLLLSAEL